MRNKTDHHQSLSPDMLAVGVKYANGNISSVVMTGHFYQGSDIYKYVFCNW